MARRWTRPFRTSRLVRPVDSSIRLLRVGIGIGFPLVLNNHISGYNNYRGRIGLSTSFLGIIPSSLASGLTRPKRRAQTVLSTGNQLRAARALLDMDQGTLAKAADVNVNTIRNMEASKDETIGANNQTMVAVQ